MPAHLRRLAACLVLLLFAASFILRGGGEGAGSLWWVERVQAVPALLSTLNGREWSAVILAGLLLLTLLFGRVFCSWLCPLGILQDLANRIARPRPSRRKGKGVRFAPHHPWLRGIMALLAFGGLAAGTVGLLTWMDPYSIAARGMAYIFTPMLRLLAPATGAEMTPPDWESASPFLMAIAALGLALPLGLAAWRGRLYCNTLCPVGTVLGLLSRVAPFTPKLDRTACGRCGTCMKACKAQAIDLKNGRVDATRCVACYNCLAACSRGAMTLRPQKKTPNAAESAAAVAEEPVVDKTRRAFLGVGITALASAALPEVSRPTPASTNPAEVGTNENPVAVPPGAQSVERFLSQCTACGLCISQCPTGVLRPSVGHHSSGFMKPFLWYGRASCDPNCVTCSQVCPTGALLPLSLAEKRHTQTGLAQYRQQHCRVWAQGETCGKCVTEAHCPTGALVAQQVQVPTVDAETCRGCRRCTSVCPAGAITRVDVPGRERKLAVIDRSKCIGCGACAAACRPQAITLRSLTAPRLDAPEKCIGCGACELACPAKRPWALSVVPRAVHLTTPNK